MVGFEKFARAFLRNPDGSWLCRYRAHFVGPYGPVSTTIGASCRKGEPIEGYDVAGWLDDWHERKAVPIGVEFL